VRKIWRNYPELSIFLIVTVSYIMSIIPVIYLTPNRTLVIQLRLSRWMHVYAQSSCKVGRALQIIPLNETLSHSIRDRKSRNPLILGNIPGVTGFHITNLVSRNPLTIDPTYWTIPIYSILAPE
jgi:hypothetical protein